jgi:polar amino acid transport system substrate-binding protein
VQLRIGVQAHLYWNSTLEKTMHFKQLGVFIVGCIFLQTPAAAEALRVAASTSWNLPYAKFENERLTGGIVFDLAQSVAKAIAMPLEFVALPRKRLDGAALAGDFDLRCYFNPQWTEIPDRFVWSPKLFELSDVIFGTESTPEPKDLASLTNGALISTVLGYGYPTLEPLFLSGKLKREDAVGQENVMLKMTALRTQYGVSDVLALNWYMRITPKHRLSTWRLGIARQDFQCAIPRTSKVSPAVIFKALDEIKRSGKIDEILKSYR